jgi:glutaredoxin
MVKNYMKKRLLLIPLSLAGIVYGCWATGHLAFVDKRVTNFISAKPNVWIFTFKDCGAVCNAAVQELKNRQVPFEEKIVTESNIDDANGKLWQQYQNVGAFPIIVAGTASIAGYYPPKVATLLGKTFGDTYLSADERRYFKNHFNADGSPRIVMYGTDWCPFCAALRQDFNNNKVEFVDIDVEKTGEETLLKTVMGINGYPATWVGYTRVFNGDKFDEIMAELAHYN